MFRIELNKQRPPFKCFQKLEKIFFKYLPLGYICSMVSTALIFRDILSNNAHPDVEYVEYVAASFSKDTLLTNIYNCDY